MRWAKNVGGWKEKRKRCWKTTSPQTRLGPNAAPEALDIVPAKGDHPDVVADAQERAKRLVQLETLARLARQVGEPAAERLANEAKLRIEKGRKRKAEDDAPNAVLRRALLKRQREEQEAVKKEAAKAREAKRLRAKVALAQALDKRNKAKEVAEKKALDEKIKSLPKTWGTAELGCKSKKGAEKREECLEKLKLRSPKLPLADEVKWEATKKEFAARFPKHHPLGTGERFLSKLQNVMERLGKQAHGANKYAKEDGGDG